MLKVSRTSSGEPEIFASIQGEGPTCGLPSVFLRLALCNLRCTWCDTDYTWDWSRHDPRASIVELDPEDAALRVLCLAGEGATSATPRIGNVVLTGGEPLLQQTELAETAGALKARGLRIEIETNGTITPLPPLARMIDQWNVSPKLTSSGNAATARGNDQATRWFSEQPTAFFKFVIVGPEDLAEVDELVRRYRVPAERTILMPEGTEARVIAERSQWLAEWCTASGYRLGARLHVMLWGNQRGR